MKDWTGNSMALFSTNGDTSHGNEEREEHDFYATPPEAVEMLVTELEGFEDKILEPCCGAGHIVNVLFNNGFNVSANDLYDHGFECSHKDFLTEVDEWHGDIITNPPYKLAKEFVEHSLDIVDEGAKVAMFLKLSFLEGKGRKELFDKYPPKTVYVSRSRLNCGKNGVFKGTSAVCYCWYVWQKGFNGDPKIVWFN